MPRKSRKKQAEETAGISIEDAAELGIDRKHVSDSLDAVIEKAGLVPASELPRQLPDPRLDIEPEPSELIKPAPEQARPRPSHDKNGQEQPTFAERIVAQRKERPTGPRKREPDELATVYTGPNVLFKMNGDTVSVDIKRPLANESRGGMEMYLDLKRQNQLTALGMDQVPPDGDASAWMGDKRKIDLEQLQNLVIEMDGKGERLAAGRGR